MLVAHMCVHTGFLVGGVQGIFHRSPEFYPNFSTHVHAIAAD